MHFYNGKEIANVNISLSEWAEGEWTKTQMFQRGQLKGNPVWLVRDTASHQWRVREGGSNLYGSSTLKLWSLQEIITNADMCHSWTLKEAHLWWMVWKVEKTICFGINSTIYSPHPPPKVTNSASPEYFLYSFPTTYFLIFNITYTNKILFSPTQYSKHFILSLKIPMHHFSNYIIFYQMGAL